MYDYLPINSNSLRTDTRIGCDLHLLVKTDTDSRYVLYCDGNAVFENEKKEMLVEKNINRLFIKKEEQEEYFKYLESNFQNIMSDPRIPPYELTQIVYNATANLVKDLFKAPRVANIKRTKEFANNIVDYILQESKAAHSLLKIATHEYYTYTHSVNVAAVGTLFAKNLGFGEDDLKQLCSGVLLHDIGKTKISTDILNKKGKLTGEEFQEIKEHPEKGVSILKETGNGFRDEYTITLQHHENYDGTGYPHGLEREEIHSSGRIVRIVDVYDALTTNRSYSKAMRPFAALLEMKEKMINFFDEGIFNQFIYFLGPYDPRVKKRKSDTLHN